MASNTTRSQRYATIAARLLRVRWLVRAPIWIFRARLGLIFGSRLLLLEHIGRKSGKARYVVLEVVDQPAPGNYVVAAGFGARAQWLRNIRANPEVNVSVGSRRPRRAKAVELSPSEAGAAITAYRHAHPKAWRTLRPVFETTLGAQINENGTTLPLVRLNAASLDQQTGHKPRCR